MLIYEYDSEQWNIRGQLIQLWLCHASGLRCANVV